MAKEARLFQGFIRRWQSVKSVKVTEVFHVEPSGQLDELTDNVLDALVKLQSPSLRDADLSATLSRGIVEISIVSIDEDFDRAVERGRDAINLAILRSGGSRQFTTTPVSGFDKRAERSDLLVGA
jgi:chromosome condensin MukBEF complex kleisin-like MukF subunit